MRVSPNISIEHMFDQQRRWWDVQGAEANNNQIKKADTAGSGGKRHRGQP